jgi:hypothetical protein
MNKQGLFLLIKRLWNDYKKNFRLNILSNFPKSFKRESIYCWWKNIYYSKLIHLTKQSIKTFIYDILLVFYQSTRRLLFYRFRLLFDSNVKK